MALGFIIEVLAAAPGHFSYLDNDNSGKLDWTEFKMIAKLQARRLAEPHPGLHPTHRDRSAMVMSSAMSSATAASPMACSSELALADGAINLELNSNANFDTIPKWCTAELGRLPDRHGAWP